jgi:hypothetical protein
LHVTADDAVTLAQMLAFPAVGGGLSVTGGHVYVDFGQMPTDKFEEMLKSIRVPIWLGANKTWYVRTDGNDANDGSANDAAHAFKTANYALKYASENYNFGAHTATVRLLPGIYDEDLALPRYNASTGALQILGSGKDTTQVRSVYCSGPGLGTLYINSLSIRFGGVVTPGSLNWQGIRGSSGTTVDISDVGIDATTDEGVSRATLRILGGEIKIRHNCAFTGKTSTFFNIDGGRVELVNDIEINGSVTDAACVASSSGKFTVSASNGVYPVITGSVTGKRYRVADYSSVYTHGGGANYFPGSAAGTVATTNQGYS